MAVTKYLSKEGLAYLIAKLALKFANNTLSNVTLQKYLGANGYYKAPDGLIIQWGALNSYQSPHTMPISFSNTNYKIATSYYYYNNLLMSVQPYTRSQIKVFGGPTDQVVIGYIAIGY